MNEPNQSSNGKPGNLKLPPRQQNSPSSGGGGGGGGQSFQQWRSMLWLLVLLMGAMFFFQTFMSQQAPRTVPYSQFKHWVAERRVADLTISQTEITGKILPKPISKPGFKPASTAKSNVVEPGKSQSAKATKSSSPTKTESSASALARAMPWWKSPTVGTTNTANTNLFQTVRVDDPNLVGDLQKAGIKFAGTVPSGMSQLLWVWLLPIGGLILLWSFMARKMGNMGQGLMSFGASKAKVVADKNTGVKFSDVAGCDEAKFELQEVVTFLRDPGHYKSLGAAIPKGILLVGPPGTGKTLLARAVAGEAQVPFFSMSGSDFVEMFVGVGAARVRDLFEKAKAQAPCIVFIDELDAVGRQRGVQMGPVNDEREQTLNQLLVGMDGFEANVGVIVLAATNRPEVLDRALLRPGRFDRQVVVDAPDLEGRVAILKLHARNKPLASTADLRKLAQQTPGFSGADLANVINEAALLTARRHSKQIEQQDLENAVDKVVAGPERKSRRLSEDDKRRVAYHEVGHALAAAYSQHADPVHKITIIPHGHAALGYTLQLPKADHYLMSRSALLDKLKGLLGGRAAEEIVFGEVSTGAENDLQQATALARQMVAVYGMSDVIGLAHCAQRQNPFGAGLPGGILQRDCSEQTAREIDQEVKRLLDRSYAEAKTILQAHRSQLNFVAKELLERETLDAKSFERLLQAASTQDNGTVQDEDTGFTRNRLEIPIPPPEPPHVNGQAFQEPANQAGRNGEKKLNGSV